LEGHKFYHLKDGKKLDEFENAAQFSLMTGIARHVFPQLQLGDKKVYPLNDGFQVVVDRNGRLSWINDGIESPYIILSTNPVGSPAIINGETVVIGSWAGILSWFKNGKIIRQYKSGDSYYFGSPKVMKDGTTIVVAAYDGKVHWIPEE